MEVRLLTGSLPSQGKWEANVIGMFVDDVPQTIFFGELGGLFFSFISIFVPRSLISAGLI